MGLCGGTALAVINWHFVVSVWVSINAGLSASLPFGLSYIAATFIVIAVLYLCGIVAMHFFLKVLPILVVLFIIGAIGITFSYFYNHPPGHSLFQQPVHDQLNNNSK